MSWAHKVYQISRERISTKAATKVSLMLDVGKLLVLVATIWRSLIRDICLVLVGDENNFLFPIEFVVVEDSREES